MDGKKSGQPEHPEKQTSDAMIEQRRDAGQKGGEATKERHGPDYYRELGRKGAEAVKQKYGPEFYKENGRKGGARMRELVELARVAEQAIKDHKGK